jgi:enoyl-CoA hydratase/carnithine racemase
MVILYQKKDKIAYITLNRPEAFNSVTPEMLQELSRVLIDFRDDEKLLVAIITGAGNRAFCAGADIKTMLPFLRENRGKWWLFPPTIMRGLELWKPLVAAVNGICLGGGLEIALACDIRIASENATFGQPEVNLGIIPGWGGTQRLPRCIPSAIAADLILTGRSIKAEEAYRIGLVNKVVPPTDLVAMAEEYAKALCRPGPLAVRAAKRAMILGSEMSLEEGLAMEQLSFDFLIGTKDYEEGRSAFLEKREPKFTGE